MANRVRDRITEFLRVRKQNDTVKIVCVLVLAGTAFFISSIYHVWEICQFVESPAEYIVIGSETVSNKRVDEIRENKDVVQVSRQMEVPVSVMYEGEEVNMDCMVLSGEYMERLTGRKITGEASLIFLNEAAFKELQKTLQIETGTEFDIRYSAEADGGTGESEKETGAGTMPAAPGYRRAKLIVISTGREEAESFIYTAETQRRLPQKADSLRIEFGKHDLDGSHVEFMRKLGYEIRNEEQILAEENELEKMLIHIRYGFIIFGICILGVVVGKRQAGRTPII